MVLCSSGVDAGMRVKVAFRIDPEETAEREVTARVVRLTDIPDEARGVWTHRMAIAFDTPEEELQGALRRMSTRPPKPL